jgi:hypothetical protein
MKGQVEALVEALVEARVENRASRLIRNQGVQVIRLEDVLVSGELVGFPRNPLTQIQRKDSTLVKAASVRVRSSNVRTFPKKEL